MILSPPHDGITPLVILPIVQLVHSHSLGLLPAIVCHIQNGLRALTEQFCKKATTTRAGKEFIFLRDRPFPRVKMSYVYLMAWFVFHCSVLIQPGEEAPKSSRFAHLHHFENSQWEVKYLVGVHRLFECHDLYSLFQCLPHIPGTQYGEEF